MNVKRLLLLWHFKIMQDLSLTNLCNMFDLEESTVLAITIYFLSENASWKESTFSKMKYLKLESYR